MISRRPSPGHAGFIEIRAELTGSEVASACGLTVRSSSPVLALCRKLVAAGYDPATRLEAYRGKVLCLKVRSIGEAALLEIGDTGFTRRGADRWKAPPVSPVLTLDANCVRQAPAAYQESPGT
jgi:hypothetical protein